MKTYKLIILSLILFAFNSSYAQRDMKKMKFREKIDSVMRIKLIENADLDSITADRFLEVYKDNNNKIRKISKEKKNLMETIEKDPEAIDMESKINKLMDLETNILDLRKSFISEAKTFLTPQQIAKTLVMRKNIERVIRKELSNRKKGNKSREIPDEDK